MTMNSGLHMFTLDDVTGEFYLTRSNIKMPRSGPIYAFNDGNSEKWDPAVKYFLNDLRNKRIAGISSADNSAKKPSARYMGALVAGKINEAIIKKHMFIYRYMCLCIYVCMYIYFNMITFMYACKWIDINCFIIFAPFLPTLHFLFICFSYFFFLFFLLFQHIT